MPASDVGRHGPVNETTPAPSAVSKGDYQSHACISEAAARMGRRVK